MDAPIESGAPDLSTALNALLSDSQLMSRISGIVNGVSEQTDATASAAPHESEPPPPPPPGNAASVGTGLGSLLSNPDVMEKLPEVMATIAPMLRGGGDKKDADSDKNGHSCTSSKRIALLCALKPYLSPRRCEAIDYIIKLDRIGSLLHNII